MDRTETTPIDSTLRWVVVGFRVLGFVWMAGLVVATLASDEGANRAIVSLSLGLAAVATVAMVAALVRDWPITSGPWLLADGAVAVFVLLAPGLAGSGDLFFGGYPLSYLVYVAYARPTLVAGATVVAVLVAGQVVTDVIGARDLSPTNIVGDVAVWIVSGIVYGWAMYALRVRDGLRLAAEAALERERAQRQLADERAEIAAHLHDSVLQTLALLQTDAEDPERVRALARSQDRELRSYIDKISSPYDTSLRSELRSAGADVEDRFGVQVQVVVVGDRPLDDDGRALVAAAREAMRNAAKYAGVEVISVYAELSESNAQVFVRDRGAGFDVEAIGPGHRGIAGSIFDRMDRHGGRAMIRSEPGSGTEVELVLGGPP
jgi:signal transduction histidine kinase